MAWLGAAGVGAAVWADAGGDGRWAWRRAGVGAGLGTADVAAEGRQARSGDWWEQRSSVARTRAMNLLLKDRTSVNAQSRPARHGRAFERRPYVAGRVLLKAACC
ncbi:hypothetical protein GCM10022255_024020 [Dactylosporangium darangshiense]|uniref:Secreted protein n=1 Tax=Dactylosporangium darangshiense TaxID=579108 RepID=A0ABP8D5V2_9ACTN